MLGAITGDIIGSVHEFESAPEDNFPLFVPDSQFTDDSVLTTATAWALLEGEDYATAYRGFIWDYPYHGYSDATGRWAADLEAGPINSLGNGSAMRVSPIAWAFDSLAETLAEAKKSAEVSHNHPEGIKGAQATACAIFLARKGMSKPAIKSNIEKRFGYNLYLSWTNLKGNCPFDATCPGSIPQALTAFFDSHDYEDCVRKAVLLGGDSDTQAAIAGSVAEAFYHGVPKELLKEVFPRLSDQMKLVIKTFGERFGYAPLQTN